MFSLVEIKHVIAVGGMCGVLKAITMGIVAQRL
jgi:hypothetical protein